MKKLLSMLLAAAMLVSASAMAFAEGTSEKGTIVYGSSTEIGGDFAPSSWWTNNATDKMIRDLTNDYGVTVTNQGGEYVVNPTIAKNIESVVNPDGSKTFTVTINEGLTYNNGEEIKAADFLWAEVFSCSKVAMDTGAKLTGQKAAGAAPSSLRTLCRPGTARSTSMRSLPTTRVAWFSRPWVRQAPLTSA